MFTDGRSTARSRFAHIDLPRQATRPHIPLSAEDMNATAEQPVR